MDINIFSQQTRTWVRRVASCKFTAHGEIFVAHRALETPADGKPRWTVSHLDTGLSVLAQGHRCEHLPTRRDVAVALAKVTLDTRTAEAVQAAVKRGREKIAWIIDRHGGPLDKA